LVDGAHTFAQFEFLIPDLNCDYFGTSLHKWLGAPIGTGLLYVQKQKIKNIWPLFGAGEKEEENIRKFEHLGTRPFFIEQATDKAIDFYNMIGAKRKRRKTIVFKELLDGKGAVCPQSENTYFHEKRIWLCHWHGECGRENRRRTG
jgi:selenocysteine lyase/cysteine desulfurase